MEENITKQKKWSWLGLLFGPYYYAGYGKFKKAVLLGFLSLIPIAGYIGVPIYCGLKAKQELPIGEKQFNWASVFGLFGIYAAVAFVFFSVAAMVEIQKSKDDDLALNKASTSSFMQSVSDELTISSIKIGQPITQFDDILKYELRGGEPAKISKSGRTVVASYSVFNAKPVHYQNLLGQIHTIYTDNNGNVCGFIVRFDVRLSSNDLSLMCREIFGAELAYTKYMDGSESFGEFSESNGNAISKILEQRHDGVIVKYMQYKKADMEM
ncbi:MAG: hypothetical protein PHE67_07325 [Campylobacterales bacterium]|nr:hypothetical protein [Campylobacterales bacterium]